MILFRYKDFDEAYENIVRRVILDDSIEKSFKSTKAMLPFTMIECDSPECNIRLSEDLYYTKAKFQKLIFSYVDLLKWEEFKGKLRESTSMSLTFYFKQTKKKNQVFENGNPCLIALVFTRKTRNSKWDEVNVYQRASELSRFLPADMVLVNVMLREVSDSCEVSKIRFCISSAYLSCFRCYPYLKNHPDVERSLDPSNSIHRKILYYLNKIESDSIIKLRQIERLRDFRNEKHSHIDIKELSIKNEHFRDKDNQDDNYIQCSLEIL